MFKPISAILFATNLTDNCKPAFDYAASLATRYQATLVLLHVIEKMPGYVEGRLRGMLGEKQYREMAETQENNARQTLIGKKSESRLIREALEKFCIEAGIDDNTCGYHSREIVVADGEIIEEILEKAEKFECDTIIMGSRQGYISKGTSIGPHIKGVLRRSKIPVTIVPPVPVE
ncbi:MAG: universal stress protein [Thermodesulfobacteriota bacterium]